MIERILLTRMKFIGDVVLTTPIIRTLRKAYPNAFIAYLTDSHAASLLTNNPSLNEIIPFNFSDASFVYQIKMYSKMIFGKFDLTIDLFSNPRSALLTFATGASLRIGGDARGRRMLYTHRVSDDGIPKSAIDYHYQSLKPLGIEPDSYKTEIFIDSREKDEAKKKLSSMGTDSSKKTVILHPGGTWPAKLWQKEKFAELALRLKSEGRNIVLTGGKNDMEAVEFVRRNAGVPYLGSVPIREIAAILSVSNLVVSNDCGIMHIAVAVDTPTIGIFGPGQENIWFPYSSPHRAFRKHVPCNPCHLHICNRNGEGFMECMTRLSVDEIHQAIREMV